MLLKEKAYLFGGPFLIEKLWHGYFGSPVFDQAFKPVDVVSAYCWLHLFGLSCVYFELAASTIVSFQSSWMVGVCPKMGYPQKKLVRQHFWYIFAMQWQFLRASLRGTCACNTHISWQKPGFFLQMCCLQALPRCWRPVKTGDIVYPPCQQGAGNRQLVGIWVVTSDSWVWPKHHLNYFETKKYMLCFVERLV